MWDCGRSWTRERVSKELTRKKWWHHMHIVSSLRTYFFSICVSISQKSMFVPPSLQRRHTEYFIGGCNFINVPGTNDVPIQNVRRLIKYEFIFPSWPFVCVLCCSHIYSFASLLGSMINANCLIFHFVHSYDRARRFSSDAKIVFRYFFL